MDHTLKKWENIIQVQKRIMADGMKVHHSIVPRLDISAYTYRVFKQKFDEFSKIAEVMQIPEVERKLYSTSAETVPEWVLEDINALLKTKQDKFRMSEAVEFISDNLACPKVMKEL